MTREKTGTPETNVDGGGSAAVRDLLELLDLERVERDIYRGRNRNVGSGRIYGGQVLAQALIAARRTVESEKRDAHSLHAYFILPGDLETPVVYFVERLRDGRSFLTRRVTAIQHGKAIFNMSASFHRPEKGISHQSEMPDVPPPEALESQLQTIRRYAHLYADRIPSERRAVLTQDRPIDRRPVVASHPFEPEPTDPIKHAWLRSLGPLGEEQVLHQAVFAYASDYGLLRAALLPHGRTFFDADLMGASLDHAMWFHRPFRMDEWLLYETESPAATGARAFTRGTAFAQDGTLVASVAQEGLIRTGTRQPPEPAQSA